MPDPVRAAAFTSIARGSGFGGLAVVTMMIGFADQPIVAMKIAGYGALLETAILLLMARHAPDKPHRRTEIWLILDARDRPPAAIAQRVVAQARREALLHFAYWAARVAAASLIGAVILGALSGM